MNRQKIVFEGKTAKGLSVTIRYPQETDVQILLDYINTLSEEKTYVRFQGEQQTLEQEEKYLKKFLRKIENKTAVKLLAFSKDQLIGVVDIDLKDKTSSHVGLVGLTVAKDFREKGIGSLLLKILLEEAKKQLSQLKVAILGVFANNTVAIKIYEDFGFKQYGRLPEGIRHRGKYVDHILMCKKV